jgi:cytochrome c
MRVFAIIIAAAGLAGAAHAQTPGDPARGEQVFKKCAICHQVGPTAKNMVGPVLNGVAGVKPAQKQGYQYSPAMVKFAETATWDDATLDKYLENPKGPVPGGKMAFVGLKNPQERADVIAYMKQFQ